MNYVSPFEKLGSAFVQVAFLAALIAAWFFATHVSNVPALLLPEPIGVFHRAIELIADGSVLGPMATTLSEVCIAFFASAIVGIIVGYFISRSTFMVDVLDPLFTSINAIPAILFFPLFALLFGLGPPSKIALGITISFFPIALNTIVAFGTVDPTYLKATRSMGASNWHTIRYVMLPATLPVIIAGLRMGFTLAFLSVLGGETIASFGGLGHQIAEASQAMDAELMYAWILIVICVSALLNFALTLVERFGAQSR